MRHYLDHASGTPLRRQAVAAVAEWAERLGQASGAGDPGRVHEEGRVAREAIETAREQVAALAGVPPRRVVFTSGASEATNTAIAAASALGGPDAAVVAAPVEHSCVREAAARAACMVELEVDRDGVLDLEALKAVLGGHSPTTSPPAVVNCQYGNHEIGTLQPVEEVVAMCREAGVPVHVDAAAAFGHLPLDLGLLDAAFVSVSAHKLGGPSGVGALILGRGVRLRPLLVGGSEERGRRAGSENLLGIVAFGAAAEALCEEGEMAAEEAQARQHCQALAAFATAIEGVRLLGPEMKTDTQSRPRTADRLPHIICLTIDGVLGEAVLLGLDRQGIAAHSGSACSSESLEPSPVLAAIGSDPDRSLRLSVGWSTVDSDVAAFGEAFPRVLGELRELGRRSPLER